ncbi:O-methyltransferase-domain-containing protein [Lineolata rhizophorae]|uniref:O-methyltransferase-domain-containing protein n=1 Tax=Lineolata rhizophorae TaxID=578093 RepID=A0A6A6NRR2_9PEZI|nr:O-methyltransferase-domain-containing protein [Lineolata rhizophorae]
MVSRDTLSLVDLAARIAADAKKLQQRLETIGHPQPSFAPDTPAIYPDDAEAQAARMKLITAALDLYGLATGPRDFIVWDAFLSKHDTMTFDVLNEFNFWHAVPIDNSASYAEIAQRTGLEEAVVRAVLRLSMSRRVFAEGQDGHIVHTAVSAAMTRDRLLQSWIGHHLQDVAPGCVQFARHLRANGGRSSTDPAKSAVAETLGGRALFDVLEAEGDGWRMRRFAEAMASMKSSSHDLEHVHAGFDWGGLGKGATVVDVGGSGGHVSASLAAAHPGLRFVVQDLPSVEAEYAAAVPEELRDRVKFQVHDFFAEQPERGATVYLLRHILHDWPDSQAVAVLRRLVAAMRPGEGGSRIVIMDVVMAGHGTVPLPLERVQSCMDLQMRVALCAHERTRAQWEELLKESDSRLKLKGLVVPPGCAGAVMEVVLEDER